MATPKRAAAPHQRRSSSCSNGGDERSHRLEAHAAGILALIDETPDLTLVEIVVHPHEQHALRVAPSTVWRLHDRNGLGVKNTAHAAEHQRRRGQETAAGGVAFAKLTAWLRKTAAWFIDDLWNAMGTAIALFTPSESRNYFEAAGFDFE